jgi:hypothetical protein
MLIIKSNKILAIESMTNEDSSYPKENAADKQPTRISKSTSTESTFIFKASLITDIAFLNIVATAANLSLVDHSGTSTTYIDKTDIEVTGVSTFESGSTDLSVFSDGDSIVIYGFTSDANNGSFVVSGTPTSNSLVVTVATLIVEADGDDVSIISWENPDVSEDIKLVFCNTWTDWFNGNAIQKNNILTRLNYNYINCTIKVTITGTLPSIGIFYAGTARKYGTTQEGYSKNPIDNSIYNKTANGSLNQIPRVININASIPVSCTVAESIALEDLFKTSNSSYKLYIALEEEEFISDNFIYGKAEQKPKLIWGKPDQKNYTINVTSIGGYKS